MMLKLRVILVWIIYVSSCDAEQCVIKGQVNTRLQWYGYMLQKTFQHDQTTSPRVEYQITYPVNECCANLLIYYDDQIKQLKESMSCQERVDVLPKHNYQVIPLSTLNATKGCTTYVVDNKPLYVCTGERFFNSNGPRTWYFALSRCGVPANQELNMNYYFNVSGYYGKCEADSLSKTIYPEVLPTDSNFSIVVVVLGVLCGISTIIAILFIVLFFFGRFRRKTKKKKTGSVTSSQATMTQDIFYVNPSLSDREHSDSQYSHSQSSTSENYYEVIPDRRSYESINTQLAMQGHNLRGVSMNPNHIRDHHRQGNIPSYILQDYPPPPYQPPPGQQSNGILPTNNGNHHFNHGIHHTRPHNSAHHVGHNGVQTISQQVPKTRILQQIPNGNIQNGSVPNGRPMQLHPSGQPPVNVNHQQHHSMSGLQTGNNNEKPAQTIPAQHGNRSGSAPVHFEHVQSIARPTPIYPTSHGVHFGTHPSRASRSASPTSHKNENIPNGHVNNNSLNQVFKRQLSAGPKLNSAGNIANGQNMQLQTYSGHDKTGNDSQGQNGRTQLLNGNLQTGRGIPNGNIANGVTQLPNGNVAKLLHDAYRIQQFETTA